MTFPILGGNGAVAGYSIDNSLRFNDGDSAHLDNTFSSTTNRKTYSYSTWIKRSVLDGANQHIFGVYIDGSNHSLFRFDSGEKLDIRNNLNNSIFQLDSDMVFRDTSAWYHILIVTDTTESTASDRIKAYVNGTQITLSGTYPTLNKDTYINDNRLHTIAEVSSGAEEFDGYIAETHFIDGQALSPTSFGEFDEDSGIWKPIQYTGSYGTNGFYLDFENSGSLGADQSGNGNNFTPTNLGATDQTTDTPTNNFATLNPLDGSFGSGTLAEGNLDFTGVSGSASRTVSTIGVTSGKWYAEFKLKTGNNQKFRCGIIDETGYILNQAQNDGVDYDPSGFIYTYTNGSNVDTGNNSSSSGFTVTACSPDDILGIALDADNKKVKFTLNGTNLGTEGDGFTNLVRTTSGLQLFFHVRDGSGTGDNTPRIIANFGNPPYTPASAVSDANGYGNFEYAPPSGYLALCTQNLATELSPTIDDGSQYFNTVLYSGTGSENAITGVGFQPDWTWLKGRSIAYSHRLYDSNRGATKRIFSNNTDAESTQAEGLKSFDSDGFTLGTANGTNQSSHTFVSWNWKANGGTTSSNTDGSITATLQSNATSGFAIATWSGTGTAGTIGHSLGVSPKLVIVKRRNSPANSWAVQHSDLASDFVTFLNRSDTGGETDSTMFNGTHPTSSVFSVGTHAGTNQSGGTYVGYIFAPISGYSAMGKYTGNGNTDGTFVYTGFRPAWFLAKRTSDTSHWTMLDTTRNPFNLAENYLHANETNAENNNNQKADFLSNGIKLRSSSRHNDSGSTFIYMAFAENPFVSSSGVPVTAR